MSATKKQINEKQRIKKMSKAQMQLAIIKKKQCDVKALTIVEQLLEPHVNPDWLLQNLGFISKSHMEDVIEERAIIKLCGYVLCSNQLTVIIRQQYHISMYKNKVYDISRRKYFCSSLCYGAVNYLLEQMLESPLWLREKEDIPIFQILPMNSKSVRYGDEIDIVGIKFSQNADNDDDSTESAECSTAKQREKDMTHNMLSSVKEDIHNSHLSNDIMIVNGKNEKVKETFVNINSQKSLNHETHTKLRVNEEDNCDSKEFTNQESNYNNSVQQVDVNLENLEIEIASQSGNILHMHEHNNRDTGNRNLNENIYDETLQPQLTQINKNDTERLQPPSVEISNNDENKERSQLQLDEIKDNANDEKIIQSKLNEMSSDGGSNSNSNSSVISSASMYSEYSKIRKANRINKTKKHNLKETNNAEVQNIFQKLAMHVERSVREWVTKNTICLLMGEVDEKNQLLENLTQHDRYQKLCKKLNRLQFEDEKEDRANLEKNVLKPLPHFSVLQEDSKKMELKVRAFYEGRMTVTSPEDSTKESETKDDDAYEPVLPLTDSHTPNALRRRIFLDNLNKILPDLMRALTTNANISSLAQCTYNNERYSLIKILVNTFNLSATNIVFKTAEWTLVGLIIIKMLSLIDTQLQSLLRSKQASMYMSMILTTYKLDSNYLDRLIMEVTSNGETSKSNDKYC
ncbi:putative RNA polymerase II subunit B1 CTD phosphatase RPAP2 [Pogonomyrmex barbatus]|uniref:RNA polymerase II subunit B1 CTD phosphatase RPAP2 homolog n=1 Tax=Pogonomyrmex barbatus TaxID=144034 RepID=A0A6I9W8V0_9HYME|nr:putative RNA polymerase II subunit B1 CTD phosphatase RPAP2 [Pogonomyrmex barbatus]